MLRPEEREDRQLEVVRLAAEQVDDSGELPVREAEGSMDGLFGDRAQSLSVAAVSDGFRSSWRKQTRTEDVETRVNRRHLLTKLP